MKKIEIKKLDVISYDDAMVVMKELHQKRCQNLIPNTLLILQHPAVITKGRRLQGQPIAFQEKFLALGIQVRDADRGGLLTYHGPGQIVVYFIVRLQDYFDGISAFVRHIEKVLKNFLKNFHVEASLDKNHPGIWVHGKKIVSIGLRVSQGVTSHGLAFNVASDLDVYKYFDPCGLSGDTMTNLEKVLARKFLPTTITEMAHTLAEDFAHSFSMDSMR